jgi:hypothetical protein
VTQGALKCAAMLSGKLALPIFTFIYKNKAQSLALDFSSTTNRKASAFDLFLKSLGLWSRQEKVRFWFFKCNFVGPFTDATPTDVGFFKMADKALRTTILSLTWRSLCSEPPHPISLNSILEETEVYWPPQINCKYNDETDYGRGLDW